MGVWFGNLQVRIDPAVALSSRALVVELIRNLMARLDLQEVEPTAEAERAFIVGSAWDATPWISVYPREGDRGDKHDPFLHQVASSLSHAGEWPVVVIRCCDDDEIGLHLYESGRVVDQVALATPGRADTEALDYVLPGPVSAYPGRPDLWIDVLGLTASESSLKAAWRRREDVGFVRDHIPEVAEVLDVDANRLGVGYRFVKHRLESIVRGKLEQLEPLGLSHVASLRGVEFRFDDLVPLR